MTDRSHGGTHLVFLATIIAAVVGFWPGCGGGGTGDHGDLGVIGGGSDLLDPEQ